MFNKQSQEREEGLYSTPDLPLATTLISLKFSLIRTDFQIEGERRSPKGYFCFEDTKALQDTLVKYMQGKLAIEPKEYETNRKSLLSVVNNTYKSPNSRFSRDRELL